MNWRIYVPVSLIKFIHAFTFRKASKVYWCLVRSLQKSNQATGAGVLTHTKKAKHNTTVLRSMHRLPVCQSTDFKILWPVLVCRALKHLGPKFICDLLLCYKPSRLSNPQNLSQVVGGWFAYCCFDPQKQNIEAFILDAPYTVSGTKCLKHFRSQLKAFFFLCLCFLLKFLLID